MESMVSIKTQAALMYCGEGPSKAVRMSNCAYSLLKYPRPGQAVKERQKSYLAGRPDSSRKVVLAIMNDSEVDIKNVGFQD